METLQRRHLDTVPERGIKDALSSKFLITPENIAYSVYPIVEGINRIKPDHILSLDRGGRIVGLATYMLHKELYGSLPTHDKSMHFEKVSRRMPSDVIYERLKPVVDAATKVNDSPSVFVIDDWMNTGKTKDKLTQVFSELSDNRINVHFGMLRGRGENVIADRLSMAICTWVNNPNLTGIEYPDELGKPRSMRSQEAIVFRKRIAKNIQVFAQQVKELRDGLK